MNRLLQRIKELDSDSFEELCFQILKSRFPTTNMHRVEGKGGDDGVDCFCGVLSQATTIWQCKSFPDGVKKAQRQQIKNSLNRAIDKVAPSVWVLCISINLDPRNIRWWENLSSTFNSKVELKLLDASNIASSLIIYKSIKDQFFPDLTLDTSLLRALATGTTNKSPDEIEKISIEYSSQVQEIYSQTDPRFTYEIQQHAAHPSSHEYSTERPNLFASFSNGERTINIFPHDIEALKQDPPKMQLKFNKLATEKLITYLKTGTPTEFLRSDVDISTSGSPLFSKDNFWPVDGTIKIVQPKKLFPNLYFKVTFTSGTELEPITYSLIEFSILRCGFQEIEMESSTKLPFKIRIVLALNQGRISPEGDLFELTHNLPGHSAKDIQKYLKVLEHLQNQGIFELHDLKTDSMFVKSKASSVHLPEWIPELRKIINDIVQVIDFHHTELYWPNHITQKDLNTLEHLKKTIDGYVYPKTDGTLTQIKTSHYTESEIETHLANPFFRGETNDETNTIFFGKTLPPLKKELIFEKSFIENLEEYKEFLKNAPLGESFTVRISTPDGILIKAIPFPS